jgi:serine kinase of HPr protein (carbohydrate metabolism regulator)
LALDPDAQREGSYQKILEIMRPVLITAKFNMTLCELLASLAQFQKITILNAEDKHSDCLTVLTDNDCNC